MLNLTVSEMTALLGGMRAMNANAMAVTTVFSRIVRES
jgi:catalase (peroxidase I)